MINSSFLSTPQKSTFPLIKRISLIFFPSRAVSSALNPTKFTFPSEKLSILHTDGYLISLAISIAAAFSGFITKSIPTASVRRVISSS